MTKIRSNAPWILAAFVFGISFAGCAGETGEQAMEEAAPPAEAPAEMPSEMPADSAMADTAMSH